MLYIVYSIAIAWEEWLNFCGKNKCYENKFFAISSQNLLLNSEGEVKLITPLSAPFPLPVGEYIAPENVPPAEETISSWNKSITFSMGLIGLELITLQTSDPFYFYKNQNLKFNF